MVIIISSFSFHNNNNNDNHKLVPFLTTACNKKLSLSTVLLVFFSLCFTDAAHQFLSYNLRFQVFSSIKVGIFFSPSSIRSLPSCQSYEMQQISHNNLIYLHAFLVFLFCLSATRTMELSNRVCSLRSNWQHCRFVECEFRVAKQRNNSDDNPKS